MRFEILIFFHVKKMMNEVIDLLESNKFQEAKKLVKKFPEVLNESDMHGNNCLHVACCYENKYLKSFFGNSKVDNKGYNALYFSCRWSNADHVRLLIKLNFDLNVQSKEGYSSFFIACNNPTQGVCIRPSCRCYREDKVLTDILIKSNAILNLKTKEGKTGLDLLKSYGRKIKQVRKLILPAFILNEI